MKIRLKGFRSLIKAVQNRAHLFPVKKLINGKTKTFYATRYVSGGEAMDIAKQGYKINSYQEAIFESKDGKKKNISEKEVLEMYDAAGKPGVLQDFIKKNFKRPKVKASTKDNGQLSFDSMMQGNNKKSKNEEKIDKYLSYYKKENHELDVENLNPIQSGDKQEKEIANKERLSLAFKYNNEIGYMKNNVDSSTNTESLKNDYNRHSKLEEIFNNRNDADYWIGTRDNVHELADLIEYDAEYNKKEQKPESGITITGPIYDDDERPTYYINDNGNVIETQDTKIVDQYRAKQKQQEETQGQESQNDTNNNKQIIIDKLQQKGATIWEKNGHRRLYFNEAGKEVADRIAKEEDISEKSFAYECLEYFTSKTYLNLRDDKLYFPSNGSNGYNLDSNYFEKFIQYTKEMHNNIDTTSNDNVKLLNVEGEKELLRAIDGGVSRGNPYKVYFKPKKMLRLVGLEDNTLDGEVLTNGQIGRMISDLGSATINLITGKVTTRSYDRENIIPKVQEALDKLISEIKAETEGKEPNEPEKPTEPEKDKEQIVFRNGNLSGGLINLLKMKKEITKVESKHEYKEVENIEGLIKQIEPLKDSHTKIKGRAIMDMLGIDADLYLKAGGVPFSGGNGTVGYCVNQYNTQTGEGHIEEIGLVADRDDPAAETKTAIHECMHARIGLSGKNDMLDMRFGMDMQDISFAMKIEESLVEMAGQAIAHKVHGSEADHLIHAYPEAIASVLPNIWDFDIFKKERKNGLLGIGMEIAKRIMSKDTSFLNEVLDRNKEPKEIYESRINAIETKIKDRSDKVDKIQNDTEISSIAILVEELKKGTISLYQALNSYQYRGLAALLITKFLEDEDIDALEELALSF